jgi:hypothetical protein
MSEPENALPPGVSQVGQHQYMTNTVGHLVPIEEVLEKDKLRDQLVRDVFAAAEQVAAAIAAFREKAFDDVDAFNALLAERYGAPAGGEKGNMTLMTYDGLLKLNVQVANLITFGPELQVAKSLVDACVQDWSDGARAELRAIVMQAFQVNQEGAVNRGALLSLLRYDIDDERWQNATQAIKDSIQITGTKRYIRFAKKASRQAPYVNVSLDVATA